MTTNQLRWAELQEGKRHNLVQEDIGRGTLNEAVRHNLVGEDVNWYTAEQQAGIGWSQASASHKQAAASAMNAQASMRNAEVGAERNRLGWSQLEEQQRHNRIDETSLGALRSAQASNFEASARGTNWNTDLSQTWDPRWYANRNAMSDQQTIQSQVDTVFRGWNNIIGTAESIAPFIK